MSASRMLITIEVVGDRLPKAGSGSYEALRAAVWDAVDEVDELWVEDDSGKHRGPYTVVCLGVGPVGRGAL